MDLKSIEYYLISVQVRVPRPNGQGAGKSNLGKHPLKTARLRPLILLEGVIMRATIRDCATFWVGKTKVTYKEFMTALYVSFKK